LPLIHIAGIAEPDGADAAKIDDELAGKAQEGLEAGIVIQFGADFGEGAFPTESTADGGTGAAKFVRGDNDNEIFPTNGVGAADECAPQVALTDGIGHLVDYPVRLRLIMQSARRPGAGRGLGAEDESGVINDEDGKAHFGGSGLVHYCRSGNTQGVAERLTDAPDFWGLGVFGGIFLVILGSPFAGGPKRVNGLESIKRKRVFKAPLGGTGMNCGDQFKKAFGTSGSVGKVGCDLAMLGGKNSVSLIDVDISNDITCNEN
jgi:hypothetical protein